MNSQNPFLWGGIKPAKLNIYKMDIGEAVQELKNGRKIQREGWNGKNMWLEFTDPDWVGVNSETRQHSFITLIMPNGELQPGWNASTPDLLATDWQGID